MDSDLDGVLVLWNPFGGQDFNSVQIPVLKHVKKSFYGRKIKQKQFFDFGYNSKGRNYKIIRILDVPKIGLFRIDIVTVGLTKEWRRNLQLWFYESLPDTPGISVEGSLHWVINYNIISFELDKEVFSKIPLPDELNIANTNQCYVAELKGRLAATRLRGGRVEIWVMEEYGVKESWVKRFCIDVKRARGLSRRFDVVVVICELRNGEILMEINENVLASYDPKKDKWKVIRFGLVGERYGTFVFRPTLFSPKETIGI